MRLVATREALASALSFCSDVVSRKSPSFVASCVLIEVSKDSAVLRATDTIMNARCTISTLAGTSGSFGVPAHELAERVKALPDGDVEISV